MFMGLVVDTSVIISVLINEKSKNKLIRVTKGEDLIAPVSLHWEIGNAFSAMFKKKRIDKKTAEEALSYYRRIALRLVTVDLRKSVEIAYKHNIYAYDAYFLECAINYNLPLITLDEKLADIAAEMNIKIIEV